MRLAGRRVTSFATIKPVPLTSENAGRVRATPVAYSAKSWSFALTTNFFSSSQCGYLALFAAF